MRTYQDLFRQLRFARCDGSFGPLAIGCVGGRFDFTLLFEQSIFAIVPSALLLLVTPYRIWQLAGQKPKVSPSFIIYLKLALCFVFGLLQISLLINWISLQLVVPAKNVTLAASGLGIADAVAVTFLTYLEHNRSVRPSSTLCVYLLFSSLFDAAHCRTLWLLDDVQPLATIFSALLAIKVTLLLLEGQNKHALLHDKGQSLGPEATSGIISRSLLWWLNGLFFIGYRTTLSTESLYSLDPELRSQMLLHRMQVNWPRYRESGKHALLRTLLSSAKGSLLAGILPRICYSAFKMSQPFLLNKVIDFVQRQGTDEAYPPEVGYALIPATALLYFGLAIGYSFSQQQIYRMTTILRGCLVSFLLHNATDLEAGAKESSAALTLITTDVSKVTQAFDVFHELWATPIELGLALWFLAMQMGWGMIGPAIAVLVSFIGTFQLSKYMGPAVKAHNEATQERISNTSSVLGSMKETKMLGLVDPWSKAIVNLHEVQLQKSVSYRKLVTLMNLLGNTPARFASVLTFGIALLSFGPQSGEKFTVAKAFTSLSILFLVTGPLAFLIFSVPTFFSSLASFTRLQDFITTCEDSKVLYTDFGTPERLHPSDTDTDQGTLTPLGFLDDAVIATRDASFSFKSNNEAVLRNINISIAPGSFTIVAGKVGSGKSVLLRGLLGQLQTKGYLKTSPGGTAFCAQTSWLMNASIKSNISGQSTMDDGWYREVVSACALHQDFKQLPNGDMSLIGTKGLSLSGGQKQRISLARALYSRKSVIVIDDVLSGLDWSTQREVWNRVFGPKGLLQGSKTTVILATHALHLIDKPDSVILLGDKYSGHVVQGTLDELKSSTGIQTLISSSSEESKPREEEMAQDAEMHKMASAAPQRKAGGNEIDSKIRTSGDFSLYLYYFKAIGKRNLAIIVIGEMLEALTSVFPEIWLMIWTAANAKSQDTNNGFYFGIFALSETIGLAIFGWQIWFVLIIMTPVSVRKLHFSLLRTVMNAPLSFFVSTDLGDLINRFSKDHAILNLELPIALWLVIGGILSFIGSTSMVLYGSKYLVAALPVMLVVLYCIQRFYLRTSRQLRHLDLEATAPLYTHLLETVDGVSTIQAYGWVPAFQEVSLKLLDDSQKPHYFLLGVQCWLKLVLELFVGTLATILIALSVLFPAGTSAGAIAIGMVNILGLSSSLVDVISSWTSLESSLGAIERLRSFERGTPQEVTSLQQQMPPEKWPSQGQIDFKKVSASYSLNSGADRLRALDNVTVSIRPGQKIAVCGRTGSGKSTLLLTLFRLLEPDSGSIMVDGLDVSHIPQNVLRPRLIAVPQEPMLFPGTLRSNLCPDNGTGEINVDQSDDRIISCLKKVELWDKISAKGDLNTDISDLGLSHGQKQLLCLARALVRQDISAVLILDEAMSAVDRETEELMVKILEEEFANHTVLSVVHRLNTVRKYDQVMVLDGGKVVEAGEPEALLKDPNGRFRALWDGHSR